MSNKRRNIIMIVIVLLVCFIIAVISISFYKNEKKDQTAQDVDVYFLNPITGTLEPETRYVQKGENKKITEDVIKILYEGPTDKSLVKIFPVEVKFLDGELVTNAETGKTLLKATFSKEYYEMDATEELFFRSSFVWTMTDLDFIDDVQIFIEDTEIVKLDGEPMGHLNRGNVVINPNISPSKEEEKEIKLYFLDENTMKLIPETRVIQVNPDRSTENYIIEELIKGPTTAGLSQTLPPETELREDVKTDDGICYVDFSNDVVFKNVVSPEVMVLNIYSIVNSLTEVNGVKKVQFLIEGAKIDGFKGTIDLSNPIGRKEEYISH